MFKHCQEGIANRSSIDDRQLITFTTQNSNLNVQNSDKDLIVYRVKMLVIANSVCLQLIVWSAVDESGLILPFPKFNLNNIFKIVI